MSKVIGVMGESGSGKTTAMRNLDPSTTFYIDCDGKGLSWKGWRNQYNKQAGNYAKTDNKYTVLQLLAIINGDDSMYAAALKADGKTPKTIPNDTKEKATKFNTVVIDTLNGIMVADEVNRLRQMGRPCAVCLGHPQLCEQHAR